MNREDLEEIEIGFGPSTSTVKDDDRTSQSDSKLERRAERIQDEEDIYEPGEYYEHEGSCSTCSPHNEGLNSPLFGRFQEGYEDGEVEEDILSIRSADSNMEGNDNWRQDDEDVYMPEDDDEGSTSSDEDFSLFLHPPPATLPFVPGRSVVDFVTGSNYELSELTYERISEAMYIPEGPMDDHCLILNPNLYTVYLDENLTARLDSYCEQLAESYEKAASPDARKTRRMEADLAKANERDVKRQSSNVGLKTGVIPVQSKANLESAPKPGSSKPNEGPSCSTSQVAGPSKSQCSGSSNPSAHPVRMEYDFEDGEEDDDLDLVFRLRSPATESIGLVLAECRPRLPPPIAPEGIPLKFFVQGGVRIPREYRIVGFFLEGTIRILVLEPIIYIPPEPPLEPIQIPWTLGSHSSLSKHTTKRKFIDSESDTDSEGSESDNSTQQVILGIERVEAQDEVDSSQPGTNVLNIRLLPDQVQKLMEMIVKQANLTKPNVVPK